MNSELQELREKCPLPLLMGKMGLGTFARSSCRSPFRNDQHASWGIYQSNGRWWFKDFGTNESGDEIDFLAQHFQLDSKRDFLKLIDEYKTLANSSSLQPVSLPVVESGTPDISFLGSGTDQQVKRLSALRRISEDGLEYAIFAEHLKFGNWYGYEVYAVTDSSRQLAEIRRLDGQWFEGYGNLPAHKSHTLKHSRKHWPLGILENYGQPAIALVEGMPDFLALHQIILDEGKIEVVQPITMLSSSCDIAPDVLPCFADKKVRIFPHQDLAGIEAAGRWQQQLHSVGASVDFFNFKACEVGAVKDLCDYNQLRGSAGQTPNLLTNLL